jgi:hypothetical protein
MAVGRSMSDSRRELVRSAAAGAVVGSAALAGQWSRALASLALFASPLVHVALVVLVIRLASCLWQKRSPAPPLIGIAAALGAELWLVVLVFGVPYWVQTSAAPAIAALDQWKVAHGRYPDVELMDGAFPDEVRSLLSAGGCPLYVPAASGYQITCRGVAFAKCTYDAATGEWKAWD